MKNSHWKIKRTIGAAFICLLILIAPAQAADWHVSEHVVGGTGAGNNWQNAMASLEDALTNPLFQVGDTIMVGQGIYHPLSNQSFTIDLSLNQLKLIGGYAGWLPTGILAPDPNQRDVQANRTILSGDLLDPPDSPFNGTPDNWHDSTRNDNSVTVVLVQNVTQGTRIEGFFIEGGAGGLRGGGMFIDDSQMDVVNCTFRFNAAGIPPNGQFPFGVTSDGGGATVRGGQTIMNEVQYTRFINCTFHDNISARGGALALVDGSLEDSEDPKVKMINCRFYNNRSFEMSTAALKPDHGNDGFVRHPTEGQSP